jgi:hypothetical protein
MKPNRLLAEVERLQNEGQAVLATKHGKRPNEYVDYDPFVTWIMGCRNLMRMLGDYAKPWNEPFDYSAEDHSLSRTTKVNATLRAIHLAIEHGLLVRLESIAVAETFDSLLEQAEHLAGEGYFLAGGVLGRAVLEGHLRAWCANAKCLPVKPKPTLSDYNQELYKAKEYDVAVMKHVDAMIAVGNLAAHNKPEFDPTRVEPLLRDLREFLGKYPNA